MRVATLITTKQFAKKIAVVKSKKINGRPERRPNNTYGKYKLGKSFISRGSYFC